MTVTRRTTLDRKLERMELEHLRRYVVALQSELDIAMEARRYAEDCADQWRREVTALQEALPAGLHVGLSVDGSLSLVEG